MDSMQVLQDICKNAEDHDDKGTNTGHLIIYTPWSPLQHAADHTLVDRWTV